MKQEYKEELEKIKELLDSEDDESLILGLNMFKTSKWLTSIENESDFNDLYIRDEDATGVYTIEELSFFLDDNLGGDITHYFGDRAEMISSFIYDLLNNNTKIVSYIELEDY